MKTIGTRVMTLSLISGMAVLGPMLTSRSLRAEVAEPSESRAYQQELIRSALITHRLREDPLPSGKTIEKVVVVPYDVILESDPWPNFLDAFHATTRDSIIIQELLFKKGDHWNQDLVDESARNMRNTLFLAVGRIVASRGSSPDRVVATIVTKDLWSLRTNWDYSYVGTKLEHFAVELAEFNLAGRNKTLGANYSMDLASQSLGIEYRDPRILGSRVELSTRSDLIWNRTTGKAEGGVGSVSVGQPLYSLDTEWAWQLSADYRKDIYRLFSGGALASYASPATGQSIPYEFQRQRTDLRAGVTRSFGRAMKQDISAGWLGRIRRNDYQDVPPGTQATTLDDFAGNILPRSERAGALFAGYHLYEADFLQLLDINSYALTEDFELGPNVQAEGHFANRAFGFESGYFEPVLNTSYQWLAGDDLLLIGADASARYQPELKLGSDWVNEVASARIRNVSPRFWILRFHTYGKYTRRFRDLNHSIDTLGANNGLRGYPSAYLSGANTWETNFELRTLSIGFHTVHIGAAGFLDMGDAFNQPAQSTLHASVGGGLRVVFPQFNKAVLRLDLGFPLERLAPGSTPAYFVSQFGQAF